MLRPKALDHVGLKVADMDETLHFYHQVLGLELLRTSGPNAEGGRWAVIKVGGQEINLFSGPDFVSGAKDNSVGVDHFCLNMDAASIDDVIADLRQVGVDNFRGPVERRDGTSVFVYDPDGIHVELRIAKEPSA
jgi:catechol 2,3-dioxygenase-like lactoylglutathione lyase family enzyme